MVHSENMGGGGEEKKKKKKKLNSVALVHERPPLVGEVNANFCG
jgi:hypothetical protein